MDKIKVVAVILLVSFWLGGCSREKAMPDISANGSATAIEVNKDGSISETIWESFEAGYYNEEELRTMVLSEVAEFNRAYPESGVLIEQLEYEDGSITMRLKYPSAEIYTAFNTDEYNQNTLFCGTVSQAYEAGYSLDISMTDPKGENTIGKEALLSMGEAKILIADQPVYVILPGKLTYIGEHVIPNGKAEAYMEPGQEEEASRMYYVIYK